MFLFWSLIQLARAGCGDEPQKNLKRHMVFLCFSVSLRCRVLEGSCCESQFTEKTSQGFHPFFVSHSGVGFWKDLAVGLLLASHAAVGFWKVLAVEIKSKKLKTPHAFHVFFSIRFH